MSEAFCAGVFFRLNVSTSKEVSLAHHNKDILRAFQHRYGGALIDITPRCKTYKLRFYGTAKKTYITQAIARVMEEHQEEEPSVDWVRGVLAAGARVSEKEVSFRDQTRRGESVIDRIVDVMHRNVPEIQWRKSAGILRVCKADQRVLVQDWMNDFAKDFPDIPLSVANDRANVQIRDDINMIRKSLGQPQRTHHIVNDDATITEILAYARQFDSERKTWEYTYNMIAAALGLWPSQVRYIVQKHMGGRKVLTDDIRAGIKRLWRSGHRDPATIYNILCSTFPGAMMRISKACIRSECTRLRNERP